jgi:hypothetical protein
MKRFAASLNQEHVPETEEDSDSDEEPRLPALNIPMPSVIGPTTSSSPPLHVLSGSSPETPIPIPEKNVWQRMVNLASKKWNEIKWEWSRKSSSFQNPFKDPEIQTRETIAYVSQLLRSWAEQCVFVLYEMIIDLICGIFIWLETLFPYVSYLNKIKKIEPLKIKIKIFLLLCSLVCLYLGQIIFIAKYLFFGSAIYISLENVKNGSAYARGQFDLFTKKIWIGVSLYLLDTNHRLRQSFPELELVLVIALFLVLQRQQKLGEKQIISEKGKEEEKEKEKESEHKQKVSGEEN